MNISNLFEIFRTDVWPVEPWILSEASKPLFVGRLGPLVRVWPGERRQNNACGALFCLHQISSGLNIKRHSLFGVQEDG